MKSRTYLIFVLAFLVLATTGIWMYQTEPRPQSIQEVLHVIIIVVVLLFALYFGYRRFNAIRKKQPAEDEFSKRIMLKASSTAYFVSLYMWIIIMYLDDKIEAESYSLYGVGILGMAILLAVFYLFFRIKGIK